MTQPANKQKLFSLLAAVLGLVLLLIFMEGGFNDKIAPGQRQSQSGPDLAGYTTALVEQKQLDDILAWPGSVHSRTVANIAPKMTARIIEIKVNAGDKVKKGDLIAKLDERDIHAQANAAQAGLAGAMAQAERAKADEQRIKSLYSKEAATRQNYEVVVAAAKQAQAAANQAASAANEVKTHLDDTSLRAPFDGIVSKRLQEPGDMGLPGVPVITMQTTQGLRLEAAVPASCAGSYQTGMDVNVRIDKLEQKLTGKIDEITPEIDPQTRTQLIKVALPATEGLQPGQYGWLEQACSQHEALLIPSNAVLHIGQLEVVKVLVEGKPVMRHVRIGKTYEEQVEVLSGLHAGETVLISTGEVN